MGLAWKCDWCGKYYIGRSCNGHINTTDSVYIKTEDTTRVVDAGVGYIVCDDCARALKELIERRKITCY